MKRKAWVLASALAGVLACGATVAAAQNWAATVTQADSGHTIGDPKAKQVLTEYVSYTCPHCAAFTKEADDSLKLAYVQPGKMKLEIRHLLRDPVDLTVAMLTNCGAAAKFPLNHNAFMLSQPTWLPKISGSSEAQRQRWSTGEQAARRKAIASDLGFYTIMERRGYDRATANRCLSDEAKAKELAEVSARDWKLPGISGTPAFAVNGVVLAGTHSWQQLKSQLDARF